MSKVRIGLIGAGNIANTHMISYGSVPNAEVVAICDIDVSKAERLAKKYGVENPFQSEEIKEKIKKTNLEKYGVENPSYSIDIVEKIKMLNDLSIKDDIISNGQILIKENNCKNYVDKFLNILDSFYLTRQCWSLKESYENK